jgi:hypothetical protein
MTNESYYYTSLEAKLKEMLTSTKIPLSPECEARAKVVGDMSYGDPIGKYRIYASSHPIEMKSFGSKIKSWFYEMQPPSQMRVDPYLCDVPLTKHHPIWNSDGCQLKHYMNSKAPRCQTKRLKWICDESRQNLDVISRGAKNFYLPEANHKSRFIEPPIPYLITIKHALVSMCGSISIKSCTKKSVSEAVLHSTANCMSNGQKWIANKFHNCCKNIDPVMDRIVHNCSLKDTPFDNRVYKHDKVFVVGEVDDTYVYHTHLEIVPRLVYHLDFLKSNPSIKIMFGCDSKKNKVITDAGIAHGLRSIKPFMEIMGLSMDRLIVHQHVAANIVYFPQEGGCQDSSYNTWHLLYMRSFFYQKVNLPFIGKTYTTTSKLPLMLVLKRSSNAVKTRNGHDSVRQWTDTFTKRFLDKLYSQFGTIYDVQLVSDKHVKLMDSHLSQVKLFAKAKVLIGVHGAGLANMLYMPQNGAVVEFGPYSNDGRILLGGGPFSRLATVMSHNYMIHHPPKEEYIWNMKELTAEFNIERFVTHIHSFLASIQFIPYKE